MIDLDNGWSILRQYIKHLCPEMMKNVNVVSYRDKYKAGPTGISVDGAPKAFISAPPPWTSGPMTVPTLPSGDRMRCS